MFRCLFWGQALSNHLRSAVAVPSPISCSSCSVSILVLSGSKRFETYPQKRTFDLTVNEHTPFCNGPAASSRHAAELTLLSVVGAQAATLVRGNGELYLEISSAVWTVPPSPTLSRLKPGDVARYPSATRTRIRLLLDSFMTAVPHAVFDLAAAQADIFEHAIVHCSNLPHVAAGAQFSGNRGDQPRRASRRRQTEVE